MIGLLDVNTLIALFDPEHVHHEGVHAWLTRNRGEGVATCPLTENGFVRVLSHPRYPGRGTTIEDAISRLRTFREEQRHSFWPDVVSLCDRGRIRTRHVLGHRQLTDVYLLALAVEKGGRLVTLDRTVQVKSVDGATAASLVVVGAEG